MFRALERQCFKTLSMGIPICTKKQGLKMPFRRYTTLNHEEPKVESQKTESTASIASENTSSSVKDSSVDLSSSVSPEPAILAINTEKEIAELKDKYLRSVADFRNLQLRTQREIADAKLYAIQHFAKDLINSVDNLERALATVPKDNQTDVEKNKELVDLYEGLKMTETILNKTLEKHGLVKYDGLGEKFDPNLHEAVYQATVPGKEAGTIFHNEQTGFMLNGRVIRPAKVGVVKEH